MRAGIKQNGGDETTVGGINVAYFVPRLRALFKCKRSSPAYCDTPTQRFFIQPPTPHLLAVPTHKQFSLEKKKNSQVSLTFTNAFNFCNITRRVQRARTHLQCILRVIQAVDSDMILHGGAGDWTEDG